MASDRGFQFLDMLICDLDFVCEFSPHPWLAAAFSFEGFGSQHLPAMRSLPLRQPSDGYRSMGSAVIKRDVGIRTRNGASPLIVVVLKQSLGERTQRVERTLDHAKKIDEPRENIVFCRRHGDRRSRAEARDQRRIGQRRGINRGYASSLALDLDTHLDDRACRRRFGGRRSSKAGASDASSITMGTEASRSTSTTAWFRCAAMASTWASS